MSSPTTRQKQARRLGEKGLRQQLCYRFEYEYGFEKGRRVIPVIVDDILDKVREYYGPDRRQEPHQIVYTAAQAGAGISRSKTIAHTPQQAVRLTMVAPEDSEAYERGAPVLLRQRLVRWLGEALSQGALLTTADLAFLCATSTTTVERHIREHERDTGKLLPLRGTVHDASSKLTHKPRIVALYRAGYLPPEIARATDHSLEAVERYLRDFELVRALATRYDAEGISGLLGRGVRVVREYLALLHDPPRTQETNDLPPGPGPPQTC